jgi:hypothetical protein
MATRDSTKTRSAPRPLDDYTVQDLDKLYAQAKGLRTRFESSWFLNLSYYMGEQWVFWNRGRVDRPRLDPWRLTLVDNRITGVVRTHIAKMTAQKPSFQVIPVTSDDSDQQSARTGEKILDWEWIELSLRKRLEAALGWAAICSAGFWKIWWDSAKGRKVSIVTDPNGTPIQHAVNGGPVKVEDMGGVPQGMGSRTLATGEVCVDVCSPFEICPDPVAKELEDCEWLIQETVKSPEWVFQHYGKMVTPDVDVAAGPSESRMYPSYLMGGVSGYRGVKVREYWCKANSRHANGRHAVWAGGEMLLEEANVYGDIPYLMFKGIPVPGRFWPTSLVEQLRGPQTELNKTISQIAENGQRLGNPAILCSRQANIPYSGRPGERIDYDDSTPNAIPTFLTPPPMPQYILAQQDRIQASIEAISGQHEVTNAQVPAGVTAASAINLLLEADDTRRGPSIYEMEEVIADAGTRILKLIATYWTDERTIMIGGADDAWNQIHFKGAMLKENTRVQVQAGSAMYRSKAARQAAIMQFLQLIVQNPMSFPMDPSQFKELLRDMEAGGLEKAFDDMSENEAQVNRENQRLTAGQFFNVNSYDDHPVHVKIHTDLQKSASYLLLPPPFQQQIEAHVVQHRMAMVAGMLPSGSNFQPSPNGGPPPINALAAAQPPPGVGPPPGAPPEAEPPEGAPAAPIAPPPQ